MFTSEPLHTWADYSTNVQGCSSNCPGVGRSLVGSVYQVPSTRGLSLQPHPLLGGGHALSLRRKPPPPQCAAPTRMGSFSADHECQRLARSCSCGAGFGRRTWPLLSAGTEGGTGLATCTRVKWCKPLHITPCLLVVSLAKTGLGWVSVQFWLSPEGLWAVCHAPPCGLASLPAVQHNQGPALHRDGNSYPSPRLPVWM